MREKVQDIQLYVGQLSWFIKKNFLVNKLP